MSSTLSDTGHPEERPHERPVPRVTIGAVVMAIATLHQLVGVAFGSGMVRGPLPAAEAPLVRMWHAGIFDSAETDPDTRGIAWFLLWGVLFGVAGLVLHELERGGTRVPASFGWGLLATCVLGVVLMPASGFWLGIIPIAMTLWRARPLPPPSPLARHAR